MPRLSPDGAGGGEEAAEDGEAGGGEEFGPQGESPGRAGQGGGRTAEDQLSLSDV